jgi:hypothetical protein
VTGDGGFGSCAAENIALIYAYIYNYISTLWLFNKDMDNDAFLDDKHDDLPLKMVIFAMLNNQVQGVQLLQGCFQGASSVHIVDFFPSSLPRIPELRVDSWGNHQSKLPSGNLT